jgi:glucose-1-phosphate cytidylyltransferase
MKAIILAGGYGTRLSEETVLKPKPMVEVGGKPILWHIMNIYACQGVREFVIALGYKGEAIKEYFLNFYAFNNDLTVDMSTGSTTIHDGKQPDWKVHLVDTGIDTMTGGRLKRLAHWLEPDEEFMFTYGDGVADIDLRELVRFHREGGKLATVTTVRVPARFGRLHMEGDRVDRFNEKPASAQGWISGGFFVLHPKVLDYIEGDHTTFENEPVERLVAEDQLMGYQHTRFWSCMDTLKEKNMLEDMWRQGEASWRIWDGAGAEAFARNTRRQVSRAG